jgi:prepilin-type N-terminal cleavage/methylation domain-containing protein
MKKNREDGFSLIELLIVMVVIAVIAVIAVPALSKSIAAAENAVAVASLRSINSAQATYYSRQNRYARLVELNSSQNGILGTDTTTGLTRGQFTYEMDPIAPTNEDLKSQYKVIATRGGIGDVPFVISVDQSGVITQITP